MGVKGQIIFIGDFLFPQGDAAAIRTLSLARICRDLGFEVTVIGKGQLRSEDCNSQTGQYYIEDIRYLTMNPKPVSSFERLRHPIGRIRQSISALEDLNLENVRAVIVYTSCSARHVPFVRAFCRKRSIPLIGDVCEWYDPKQMNYGRFDPTYAFFLLMFHCFLPRIRNLIVISKFLGRYFDKQGHHLVRIPPVVDPSKIPCIDCTPKDRLVLLYVGLPGRKDLLKEFFLALTYLTPDEQSRVEFRLIGPTKEELVKLLGKSANLLDQLSDIVKPLGRLPSNRVLKALNEAHFTILLRPNKRYSNAGFPSKVPESLAAGVPILLNLTSDLEEYLGDETASVLITDCSSIEVAKAIRRALQFSPERLQYLRQCARAKAEQYFDYRRYLDSFKTYLEQLN